MKIIGFTGRKLSGKTTIANEIIKQVIAQNKQKLIVHVNFADALKRQVAEACNVTLEEIEQNKAVFRPMLQWWGTEFRRRYCKCDDYWIRRWEDRVDSLPKDAIVVCSDVRFDNEAKAIQDREGFVISVENISLPESDDTHASEQGISSDLFDITVVNSTQEGLPLIQRIASNLITLFYL